ncbi:hypothetical protein ABBQ32_14166 [Trebouxia sp. C0010 RCD-2024]
MAGSKILVDFIRQPGLRCLRNEHVRLDVRVILSLAARSALVDVVVVQQESQVAAAFIRMPENCDFSKGSCSLAFNDKAMILTYREVPHEEVKIAREDILERLASLGTRLIFHALYICFLPTAA